MMGCIHPPAPGIAEFVVRKMRGRQLDALPSKRSSTFGGYPGNASVQPQPIPNVFLLLGPLKNKSERKFSKGCRNNGIG